MARLDADTIAVHAAVAGLPLEHVATALAISGWNGSPVAGESGGNPAAEGDVALANDTWGPSVGLWQIRSLNADRGTGRPRDADRLTDPLFNAKSMVAISGNGTNWRPWTVFTTGVYLANLPAARAIVDNAQREGGAAIPLPGGISIPVPDAVPDTISGGASFVSSAVDTTKAVGLLAANLISVEFWKRVGLGALGLAVIIGGLVILFGTAIVDQINPLSSAASN